LLRSLHAGEYFFSPCRAYKGVMVWNAQDSLVQKAMALVLTEVLQPMLSERCFHVKGNGGAKGCVRAVNKCVADYHFVCRSDVNSYYATVDHAVLMKLLRGLIDDEPMLVLLERMLQRLDDVAGELLSVDVGITKGNPLSPLLGAVYLLELDNQLGDYCKENNLFYGRFMDDWVVLCKKRNQLRVVVRLRNRVLDKVRMTKHPFKTFIGRIKESGFDFLGYRLGRMGQGLGIAWATWVNHQCKLRQLYEQGVCHKDIGEYVERWLRWVRSGVKIDFSKASEGFRYRGPRIEPFFFGEAGGGVVKKKQKGLIF